jgi:hypothetical protein
MHEVRRQHCFRANGPMTARKHLVVAGASLVGLWISTTAIHWAMIEPRALTASAHAALLHVLGSTVGVPASEEHLLWSTAVLVLGFVARVYTFSVIALFAVKPYIDRRVREAYAYARIAAADEGPGTAIRSRSLLN